MKNIAIIIPTYMERENLVLLIPEIEKIIIKVRKDKFNISLAIIDDCSPDNTNKLIQKLQKKYGNLFLLEGKKNGYGSACYRGFKYALEKLNADYVIQMDADFSHNPKEILVMLKKIETDQIDMIIGSRYIKGGSIPNNWPFLRKLNSKWGNRVARYITGMKDVKDCTSGYRCIRKEVIEKVTKMNLNNTGYTFLLNFLFYTKKNKFSIYEIPIQFVDRVRGNSKISFKDIIEFIKNAFTLRFKG